MSGSLDQDKSAQSGAPRHLSDQELAALQLQLADDLKLRFKANLEAFSEFLPDVTAAFSNYRPKKTLQFFCTENGVPNLMFPDEHGRFFYNCDNPWETTEREIDDLLAHPLTGSAYGIEHDPYGQIHFRYINEAVRRCQDLIKAQPKADYSAKELGFLPNALLMGLGLGYPLGIIYSKAEIANLIAIEPDPDIFYASLHAFDWASLLQYIKDSDTGFKLIVGQTPAQLYGALYDYYTEHGEFLSAQAWSYVHYESKEITACAEVIAKDYYRIRAAKGFYDDHLFGASHGFRSMLMGKHFVRRSAQLPQKFREYPLFVVANGPSLDHDIPFLRKNQDKAMIIACGTALDTLYHAGVKPDFYAATERTPEISETIDAIPDQEFKDSLTLVAGDVIHPKTSMRFKHTAIFGKPDEPFYWFIAGHHEKMPRTREIDMMNPLVGNLGIAAIFGFGFKESYLFGIDNGRKIREDGSAAMHSQYSSIYGAAGVFGQYSVGKNRLPGNFGGLVESNPLFRFANQQMETVISEHRYFRDVHFKIHNCSDGARIEGTIPAHSEDLRFGRRPELNKQELMDYIENELTFKPEIKESDVPALMEREIFYETLDRLEKLVSKKPATRLEFVRMMMQSSEVISLLTRHPSTIGIAYCLHGSIMGYFMEALYALMHVQDDGKAVDEGLKILNLYKYFMQDARKMYAFVPDYVLGDHYHFMDGKVGWDHEDSPAPKAPPYPHLFKKEFDDPQKKFVKRYE